MPAQFEDLPKPTARTCSTVHRFHSVFITDIWLTIPGFLMAIDATSHEIEAMSDALGSSVLGISADDLDFAIAAFAKVGRALGVIR